MRVCFVCLGNICRSPTAEAVMRHRVAEAGLTGTIEVESAGTGSWHVGDPPDARAAQEARARGFLMDGQARQFRSADFARFDLVLAMDEENAAHLRRIAPDADAAAKVRLLREFDPGAAGDDLSVPDPYYGGPDGFSTVFELVDAACRGLVTISGPELREAVGALAGSAVAGSTPVAGGDINRAERMSLVDGRELFVKHREGAPAGMYAAEAAGLAWLAAPAALRTPAVVAVGDERPPRFLALEWIPRGRPAPGHDEALGSGLAALHRAGPPAFGLADDNFIGSLPQRNGLAGSWPEFYGERRLEPLARMAADAGTLGPGFLAGLERLRARLPDLTGPPEPPARLHGDLWGGNAMTGADGEPVLIDPAVYGGHREIDLAMMRLFGGFSPTVFAAYAEAHPLAPGHEDRVELYQLYPVLVHVVLFGGGYARSAERILRRYAG